MTRNRIHHDPPFKCPDTEALFHSKPVRRFKNIERVARRKLLQLHAATLLESLRIPPGNQLEALKDDHGGSTAFGSTISGACFIWKSDGAHGVEIVDYH